jgi:hypothetical protein
MALRELEGRGREAYLRRVALCRRHVREGGAHGRALPGLELCPQDATAQIEPERVLARQHPPSLLRRVEGCHRVFDRDCPRKRRALEV